MPQLDITANWNCMLEGLTIKPDDFYAALEESLKEKGLFSIKYSRVKHSEGGVLSTKREYLRLKYDNTVIDLFCGSYGNGIFVSWWQGTFISFVQLLLRKIPLIGQMFEEDLTYYKVDTGTMFNTLFHNAVLNVIDDLTTDQGVGTLAQEVRTPDRKRFFS